MLTLFVLSTVVGFQGTGPIKLLEPKPVVYELTRFATNEAGETSPREVVCKGSGLAPTFDRRNGEGYDHRLTVVASCEVLQRTECGLERKVSQVRIRAVSQIGFLDGDDAESQNIAGSFYVSPGNSSGWIDSFSIHTHDLELDSLQTYLKDDGRFFCDDPKYRCSDRFMMTIKFAAPRGE